MEMDLMNGVIFFRESVPCAGGRLEILPTSPAGAVTFVLRGIKNFPGLQEELRKLGKVRFLETAETISVVIMCRVMKKRIPFSAVLDKAQQKIAQTVRQARQQQLCRV